MDNGIFQGGLFQGMGDEGQPDHAFKRTADSGLFHAHIFSGMQALGQDKTATPLPSAKGGDTASKTATMLPSAKDGGGATDAVAPLAPNLTMEPDNTMLYVGIGAASLVALGVIGYFAFGSKPAPRAVAANRRRRARRVRRTRR
jgi:hypothetical protein